MRETIQRSKIEIKNKILYADLRWNSSVYIQPQCVESVKIHVKGPL